MLRALLSVIATAAAVMCAAAGVTKVTLGWSTGAVAAVVVVVVVLVLIGVGVALSEFLELVAFVIVMSAVFMALAVVLVPGPTRTPLLVMDAVQVVSFGCGVLCGWDVDAALAVDEGEAGPR